MAQLVRMVWFVSCPLLTVSATVHVQLERAAAAEIEHYMDIETRQGRSTAQRSAPIIPTIVLVSPNNAPLGCVWDVLGRRTASGLACSDTRTAASRAITVLKTIRLLL